MTKLRERCFRILPLAEVIMICGFFFISGLEEVLHYFLHPHATAEESQRLATYGTVGESDEENINGIKEIKK